MGLSKKTKKIVNVLILSAFLLFILIIIPQMIGLGKKGFTFKEVLEQYFFYVAPGIGFLIGILILFFIEMFITEKDDRYGDSIGFFNIGDLPYTNFLKRFTPIQLTLLALILFFIMGMFFVVTDQKSFTGFGSLGLEQQFTQVDSIIYSTSLIPTSENLGLAFFLAFFIFLLRFYARKINMNKSTFVIIAIILAFVLGGSYGLINHFMRYSDQQISLVKVFFFWGIGGFLTILIGFFVVFLIMHMTNNFFYDLARSFSKDNIVIFAIFFIIILIIIYSFVYRDRLLGKKPT